MSDTLFLIIPFNYFKEFLLIKTLKGYIEPMCGSTGDLGVSPPFRRSLIQKFC